MSGKNKPVTVAANGPAKSTTGSNGKRLPANVKQAIHSLQILLKDEDGLQEYESLVDSKAKLEKDLQQKDRIIEQKDERIKELEDEVGRVREQNGKAVTELEKVIEQQKKSLSDVVEEFRRHSVAWEAEKMGHAADSMELTELKGQLDTARKRAAAAEAESEKLRQEVDRWTERLEECQKELSATTNKCERRGLQLKEANTKLEECRKTLEIVSNDLGIQPYEPKILPKIEYSFKELSTRAHELVWHHFGSDIPDPTVITAQSPVSAIPQVASNSPAARSMRCGVAEAVIAHELATHIFRDFYLSENAAGIEAGRRAIEWLKESHPLEATIIRCQLARACYSQAAAAKIPTQAAQKVCALLGSWLRSNPSGADVFRHDLEVLCSDAMGLWYDLQRARKVVRAVIDVAGGDWDQAEDKRDVYDEIQLTEEPVPTYPLANPLAVLFPQIIAGEDILFHGYALFSNQKAVAAATKELTCSQRDLPSRGVERRRRLSRDMGRDRVDHKTKASRRPSSSSGGPAMDGSTVSTSSDFSHLAMSSSSLGPRKG